MKDKLTPVIAFMKRWNVQIPQKEFENWRQVVCGTYTHKNLPLGAMREGITDGLHSFLVSGDRVVEVCLANLNCELDHIFVVYRAPKKKVSAAKANSKETQDKLSKKIQKIFDELL